MNVEERPVVLLASSRSDGNTAALAHRVFPGDEVRFIDLATLCIGYFAYDHAHDDDDFLALVRDIVRAPLWVLATPLHWYTMSAQAKTFIDRLSDLLDPHREWGRALRGKDFAVVCAGTDPDAPAAFDEPFRLTCDYLGLRYRGSHYARFAGDVLASSAADAVVFDRFLLEGSGP